MNLILLAGKGSVEEVFPIFQLLSGYPPHDYYPIVTYLGLVTLAEHQVILVTHS